MHGHYLLKRAIKELGNRALDHRTWMAKALAEWKVEILRDRGGQESVSAQKQAVLDLAMTTKLLLDSVDVWLLQQPSVVNARKRCRLAFRRCEMKDSDSMGPAAVRCEQNARQPIDTAVPRDPAD